VIELGYDNVWLQPGADSPELLAKLEAAGLRYVADSCIMVRARFSGV
jgi:predicted CoA-binding protein